MTMRELVWAAEGRGKFEWLQTSHVLACIVNVNRNPKTPVIKPERFNPYAEDRSDVLITKDNIGTLKDALGFK